MTNPSTEQLFSLLFSLLQGECRATTAALIALAKAHGLDVNAYMERLTKAMA